MERAVPARFNFADFELDAAAYELRRHGQPVRLERRPMDLLRLLLERRGQLVSRAEIIDRLWGDGVFVDVETGINTAVRKLRAALRDPADAPAFVRTVAGRGYRFAAPVEVHAAAAPQTADRETLAVLPFESIGLEPARGYLADGLTEETIARLGQIDPERLGVVGRTSVLAYKRAARPLADIGRELAVTYLLESSCAARARACASRPSWCARATSSRCGRRHSTASPATCWRSSAS
jgi:DNA-binding winged helix-turn-helix (wHTH) protein